MAASAARGSQEPALRPPRRPCCFAPTAPLRSGADLPTRTCGTWPGTWAAGLCSAAVCAKEGVLAHAVVSVWRPVTAQQHTRCQLLSSRSVHRGHPAGCEVVRVALKCVPYRLQTGTFTGVRAQQVLCAPCPVALSSHALGTRPTRHVCTCCPRSGRPSQFWRTGSTGVLFCYSCFWVRRTVFKQYHLICKINTLRTFYL